MLQCEPESAAARRTSLPCRETHAKVCGPRGAVGVFLVCERISVQKSSIFIFEKLALIGSPLS